MQSGMTKVGTARKSIRRIKDSDSNWVTGGCSTCSIPLLEKHPSVYDFHFDRVLSYSQKGAGRSLKKRDLGWLNCSMGKKLRARTAVSSSDIFEAQKAW